MISRKFCYEKYLFNWSKLQLKQGMLSFRSRFVSYGKQWSVVVYCDIMDIVWRGHAPLYFVTTDIQYTWVMSKAWNILYYSVAWYVFMYPVFRSLSGQYWFWVQSYRVNIWQNCPFLSIPLLCFALLCPFILLIT